MPFLYGNNVVKAHLGRITDDTPEDTGVIVYSMADTALVSDDDDSQRERWMMIDTIMNRVLVSQHDLQLK